MKLAPIVISMMLMALVGPTVVQKMLSNSNQTVATAGTETRSQTRAKRAKRERIAVANEDYDEDDYEQPGQASATRDRSGHFSFNAVMNGSEFPVLVDTGATSVAINMSTAEEMGIVIDEDSSKVTVNTANGRTVAYRVNIEEIVIEDVVVSNVEAVVLEDEALSSTLLGMSFLSKLERFEISGDTLTLTR